MNMHYDKLTRRFLNAFGYQFEMLKTEKPLTAPQYTLYVFDFECPSWCDADSYERNVSALTVFCDRHSGKNTWLYGHEGFEIIGYGYNFSSVYDFPSEYYCCKSFINCYLDGQLRCFHRIPMMSSVEEMKLWLTATAH